MIKTALKNFRLLLISIGTGAIYYFMEFSDRFNNIFNLLVESHSSIGLGVFILLKITKFTALIFSVVALILFLKVIFFNKKP